MEKKKILLVEDDPDHADLITEGFREVDIETVIILVRDGMGAIDYIQEHSVMWNEQIENEVKLIILDLNLPKVNGMDVLKFLKKNSKYSKIPVIVLSVCSEQKTIDEAYNNGVNGYIIKPASYEEFVEKIEILLNLAHISS